MDYNQTLNLPQTEFPMRAGLPTREPEALKEWQDNDIYGELMKKNEGKPSYILHDGPPYANGVIHMGTALNKSLKDFVLRYKNMTGFKAPYVPGYDTHGLPTELKARKKVGVGSTAQVSAWSFARSAVTLLWALLTTRESSLSVSVFWATGPIRTSP